MVEKKLFSTKSLDALVIISTLSSHILQRYTVEAKKRKQCYKEVKRPRNGLVGEANMKYEIYHIHKTNC